MRALTILASSAFLLVITTTATLPRVALAASDDQQRRSILWRRGSIAVGDDALVSPSGDFSCGFHRVATNAYVFAVWFTASADPPTLAWAANRDAPVNGMGSRAELLRDGSLVLRDFDGLAVWSTNTSSTGANRAELLDTGNLVVSDAAGRTLWQSFDWPTDTLLPGQTITRHASLVSAKARGSTYSGYYSFYFDNFNILNLMYDGPEINMNYWPDPFKTWVVNKRTAFNSSRLGSLDDRGRFSATDNLRFAASDMGAAGHVMRRLTLDYDGNLRAYSLDVTGGGVWHATWAGLLRQCGVHGICGRYGVCAYGLAGPACACPEGFVPSDPGDWSKGCRRLFDIRCGEDVYFAELPNVDYWGFDYTFAEKISIDECRQMCLDDCNCEAFGYKKGGSGKCYTKISLWNGRGPEPKQFIYFKIPTRVEKKLNLSSVLGLRFDGHACSTTTQERNASVVYSPSRHLKNVSGGKIKFVYFYGFLGGLFVVEAVVIIAGYLFIFRGDPGAARRVDDDGYSLVMSHFRKFAYDELSNATCNFGEELWRGASGAVYKGVLDDGRDVAVTQLVEVTPQAEELFRSELSVIGRINHMNLVRIWGFCSERSHRLLVSEYVENGSLAKALFGGDGGEQVMLGWQSRYKIAVGVAKGLAYLHHECLEWILHCDMKPENVLLDADLEPKITGFGLVKLLSRQEDACGKAPSCVMGKSGHVAPEWALSLPITGKADVYSFGIVLLELLRGQRVSEWAAVEGVPGDDEEARVDLQEIVGMFKDETLECQGERSAPAPWLEEFVDARLLGDFNRSQATVMLEVAVSCVEDDPSRRPSMNAVVQKLLSSQDVVGSASLRRDRKNSVHRGLPALSRSFPGLSANSVFAEYSTKNTQQRRNSVT